MKSLLGTKVGMTQVFTETGKAVAATVIYVEPNKVLAVKTNEKDGYSAIQIGYETVKEKALNKPLLGQSKRQIQIQNVTLKNLETLLLKLVLN